MTNERDGGDESSSGEPTEAADVQHAQGSTAPSQATSGLVDGAGTIGGEAGQLAATTRAAVQSVSAIGGAVSDLGAGRVGSAAGGLGAAASAARYVVPDREAQQVLDGAAHASRAGGAMLDGASGLLGATGDRINVEYHLELGGFDAQWGVRGVHIREHLSSIYECLVEARCDAAPEVSELLALDVHLQIERGDRARTLHGFVKHAEVTATGHGSESLVRLEVVPALWLLGQNVRSRVFTDKTVPQVVEAVFRERLGGRSRSLRNELTRDYPIHELLVQYQETDLAFLQRRLEQEGIFYYFVHDGDHEELVLADTNSNLPNALDDDSSRVAWGNPQSPPPGGECISEALRFEQVGTTDVVVAQYNWTAPEAPPTRGERTGRGELDPPLELYDHIDAVLLHRYDGNQYGANDATDQARMRSELLDLRRQRWSLTSNVVTARPGHVIELSGCPDGALDGRYVIVSVDGHGSANEGSSGGYSNELQVVPAALPYRPPRRTLAPIISGFESAVVVGPDGDEIHTDEHGRVQVRFHWDRDHSRSEPNLCSCWVRVMQSWAGPGFGTTYIPRVGMEVVIAFMGGSPDQPFVMGCLFHGTHHSPVVTPDDKTQSAIRTKSSPNSDGFNELRFEDKAGSEFIFTHAQKDYNEVVEHNHSTHVKNNQTNTVDVNQTELVGGEQKLTVKKDRLKTIEQSEFTEITLNRTETVYGSEDVFIKADRSHTITKDESLLVEKGKRSIVVQTGKDEETYKGGRETQVSLFDNHRVVDGANHNVEVSGQYNIKIDGHFKVVQAGTETIYLNGGDTYIEGAGRVQVKSDGAHLDMKPGGKVELTATSFKVSAGGCTLKMEKGAVEVSGAKFEASGGASAVKLEASGATMSGPSVTSSADGMNEITGLLVKIN